MEALRRIAKFTSVLIGRRLCQQFSSVDASRSEPTESSSAWSNAAPEITDDPTPSRQFVTPSVFENRLISRSRLVRADDRQADAIGLLNQETGEHILVDRLEWLKHTEIFRDPAVSA